MNDRTRKVLMVVALLGLIASSAQAGVLDWISGLFGDGGAAPADPIAQTSASISDVVQIILALLGVASMIARITPTTADDAIVRKILNIVHVFGLTKPEARTPTVSPGA